MGRDPCSTRGGDPQILDLESRASSLGPRAPGLESGPEARDPGPEARGPRCRSQVRDPERHLLRLNPVASQLALQRPSVDPQRRGRSCDVSVHFPQHRFDVIAFDVSQTRAAGITGV